MQGNDWLTAAARAGTPYHFRRKTPWRHNLIGIAVLATIGLGIVSLLALAGSMRAWAYVPIAGLGFGLLYYPLLAIVVHEASHGMMFLSADPRRRRRCNRVIGWVCAVPFGIHYRRHWEAGHLTHHVHPLEPTDPQAFNHETGRRLAVVLALLLLVPGAALVHRFAFRRRSGFGGSSIAVFAAFVALWTAILSATVWMSGWKPALALAYGLQVLAALNQIKGALEHGGPIADDPERLFRSRSTIVRWRVCLPMFYVTLYHFEHHLNYAVPWYDLPRYHRDVRALVPAALQRDIFNADLLAQLAGHKGRIARAPELT